MINDDKAFSLQVCITTEDNYFSQGIIFLLSELFNDEYQSFIMVSLTDDPARADLVLRISAPGEKAFDWVDCRQFQLHADYKLGILSRKTVMVYPRPEHHDRNFSCPALYGVIAMKDPVAVIRRQFYMMYFSDSLPGPPDLRKPHCGDCIGQHDLTYREQQMVGYFCQGVGSADIARRMDCNIKAISNYRRAVMRKLNIKNHSDFALWLVSKSVAEKHANVADTLHGDPDDEHLICKEKISDDGGGGLDDKERVMQSMRRLMEERLQNRKVNEDIWLTTREIANEMDISIYSMRYLLCQMENNGEVNSTQTGKGRNKTLRWQLAG